MEYMNIRVQLPGNRHHYMLVHGDELIGDIRYAIADYMNINPENWGIYINGNNRLSRADDSRKLSDVLVPGIHLHFYPNVVMR